MKNQITMATAKMLILDFAAKSREHQSQVEKYRKQIEPLLVNIFPSLEGKVEDGPEDWSCDIINAETDAEVDTTIKRIADIEKRRGAALKIKMLNERATKLRNEIEEINAEIVRLQNL